MPLDKISWQALEPKSSLVMVGFGSRESSSLINARQIERAKVSSERKAFVFTDNGRIDQQHRYVGDTPHAQLIRSIAFPGDSGGAVFSSDFYLIGVLTAVNHSAPDKGRPMSYGSWVPFERADSIWTLRALLDKLNLTLLRTSYRKYDSQDRQKIVRRYFMEQTKSFHIQEHTIHQVMLEQLRNVIRLQATVTADKPWYQYVKHRLDLLHAQ